MAIAAAAPALSERVEPYWVIATSEAQASTTSGVSPGPSEPKTRQQARGRDAASSGTLPGRLSTPTRVTPAASAQAALQLATGVLLRLFAPFLPFVTEEVWSWWQSGSVHTSAWPEASELPSGGDAALLDDIASALIGVRGAKSQAKVSMKTEAVRAEFSGTAEVLDRLRLAVDDLRAVGRLTGAVEWTLSDGPLSVSIELKQDAPA